MLKAAREAQVHTSWVNPDPAYEDALQQFVRAALDASRPNPFLEDFAALREMVAHAGAINALAQTAAEADRPRGAGHLSGDGAVGPESGRPGQPPPGRLRGSAPASCGGYSGVAPAAGSPPICSRRKRTGG